MDTRPVLAHNLEGRCGRRARIGCQDHQVDAGSSGGVVQLGFQVRVVVEKALVSPHALGHLQAGVGCCRSQSPAHRTAAPGPPLPDPAFQSDHGHVFARLEMGLAVAEGAEPARGGPTPRVLVHPRLLADSLFMYSDWWGCRVTTRSRPGPDGPHCLLPSRFPGCCPPPTGDIPGLRDVFGPS